jgi:isoleucyl-tRNA synthetase
MPRPPKRKQTKNFLDGDFNLPKLEEKVLAFWNAEHIFEKSVARAAKKKFIFYEGPPYANGKPGIHHVLSRVVKDVILRYKTMQGYSVPRRAGWDTHGLPVEMAAEKALGLKSKKDIEKYGIKLFNEKAKEQVWLYKDEWEKLTNRIGYWLDLKNAYITYEPEYIETIWWTLAEISKRKLLYKGHKVVPWCTRCGTALSSHELAQGYKETVDTSVYVKFKLNPGQKFGAYSAGESAYILSWTTTPWTLPGNVALAVGEKISYTALRMKGGSELYILASDLVKSVLKEQIVEIVHNDIKGSDLVGLEYEPLFDVAPLKSPVSYKVYPADFVTTTDGTGVVHTAVMYGEDDYALGKRIGLPEKHTVDEEGKFKADVRELAGDYVKAKETEEKIFTYLEKRGFLLRTETYTHEYPYCWRCGTAILYYARTSWFIGMSGLRKELMARNKTVNWMPEHVKQGRFGEWIKEAKDWNLSRERYWGAPLPIWECAACGHTDVVGSLDALDRLAGGSKNNYWIMRHGEAESNLFNIIDSGQRKNLHLTPRGKKQAEHAAKQFKKALDKRGEKIDVMISSDIVRTRETAAIMGAALGVKPIFDSGIEEIHLGPTLTGNQDKKYSEMFPTYKSRFTTRPVGGESLVDLRVRMWEFMKKCEANYRGKNILIVTHEYPAWMLSQVAEGWSERRAVAEKESHGRDFITFAEVRKLAVKTIPRNDTGEVDLHRPFADVIDVPCPQCKAGTMKRVREVADVWYDSGAMPYAQAHYPFEGKTNTKTLSGLEYPADYIAEGMDQTRGWFYTLLAIATALGYKAPYKNVVVLGLINDKFGQKMSKSKGNIVEPFSMIDAHGVDAVRWYFYTSAPLGEPKNFDDREVAKAFRRVHLIVYNSLIFWKTYADQKATAVNAKNALDAWILARLNEATASVTKNLDAYEIREAALEIEALVDDLSRWYIRRSRRRLQRPESVADYKAASATLRYILLSLVKLMAPFTPFFSEILYAELGGTHESVHLDAWPAADKKVNKNIILGMKAVRDLAAQGLAKRAEAGIKVRQPLTAFRIKDRILKSHAPLLAILADEVNVKKVLFVTPGAMQGDGELDTTITPELREEGLVREVIRMVQGLRQDADLEPKDRIAVMLELGKAASDAIQKNEALFKEEVGAQALAYKKSDKFTAEQATKLDGQEVWVGIRRV